MGAIRGVLNFRVKAANEPDLLEAALETKLKSKKLSRSSNPPHKLMCRFGDFGAAPTSARPDNDQFSRDAQERSA
jgi:hypothetical protein